MFILSIPFLVSCSASGPEASRRSDTGSATSTPSKTANSDLPGKDVEVATLEDEESLLNPGTKSLIRNTRVKSPNGKKEVRADDPRRKAIVEYRKTVFNQLVDSWKSESDKQPLVVIKVDKDGVLLASRVKDSSGDSATDAAALTAVRAIKYAPLPPEIVTGQLGIRIDFSRIRKLQDRRAKRKKRAL